MEIIGAAALITVGLVFAALVYGRTHRVAAGGSSGAAAPTPERVDREQAERSAALARREDALAKREAALDEERLSLQSKHAELERMLEQASGMPASRAKQVLLQQIEEDARHDAARRIRQIEEETKREA